MIQEEIIDYNRRCAEFLGMYDYSRDNEYFEKGGYYAYSDKNKNPSSGYYTILQKTSEGYTGIFNSDWNWIMEVIEAIEKKSEHIIMGRPLYNSFDIGKHSIKFYFNPNNNYLLQLELKQWLPDEPWKNSLYKNHIIKEFDFKKKGKKEAVVEAINQFLIWYNKKK